MATIMIDEYSMATAPINIRFNTVSLAEATSFVWQDKENRFYLISNWHNFTGIDPNTGVKKNPTAPAPNQIAAMFTVDDGRFTAKQGVVLPLRDDDDRPLWLVHPRHGKNVDVVALPLPNLDNFRLFPINKLSEADILLRVGSEVFILGYPFGLTAHGLPPWTGALPIWKKASVASEPALFPQDRLNVLVDTASRPGMSGSPVVARSTGSYVNEAQELKFVLGHATKFIGVYSGRLVAPKDGLDVQLGIFWPRILVEEIVQSGVLDRP